MQRKLRFIFLLIPAFFWTMSSFAQAKVSANINTGKITIGQHIQLFLEVQSQSAQDKVIWPNLASDSLKGLEWVEFGKIDTLKSKDSLVYKQQVTLTGFDSGTYVIPAIQFQISSGNQTAQTFSTDSLIVQVQTVAVDTTKAFMPINGILQVKSSWLDYWKTILLVVLGVLILLILILYFRKKWLAKKKQETGKVSPEKAHERALRLLDELKTKDLWKNGKVKEYYAELSNILRSYLDNRFEVNAMELTTDELLKLSKRDSRIKPVRPELKRILKIADLAKYAKAEPLQSEQESCLESAYFIVQKTKMKGEEANEK